MKNKKIKQKNRINNFFELTVYLYIYGAIFGLIIYMLGTLATKFFNMFESIFNSSGNTQETASISTLQHELLHNIAFTIVLVKAYNILMEYAKHKHVNIKYIIEISIIAPVVEVVFNYGSYDFNMLVFLGILSICMSILYLFFYDKLKIIENDYKKEHEKNIRNI
ncbi:hypothetical protein CSB08_01415 [Candidatus Gracilibacteria bacterium]|nr:MAG: hypothetical protein CSB08_01415 [Candidatus Gracilibacteria bacterium]